MSRRTLTSLLAALVVLSLLALLAAGCGSGDDSGGDDDATVRQSTDGDDPADDEDHDADAEDAPADPTPVPDPVPDGTLPPIQVTSPAPLAYVNDSFLLTGSAQVFEGTLRWQILDEQLRPQRQGTITATCGAPCRGTFRSRIPLRGVQVGSWELHVFAPPVADDDPPRVHDVMVPITVTDEPVAGAPDADAQPPGGVPVG